MKLVGSWSLLWLDLVSAASLLGCPASLVLPSAQQESEGFTARAEADPEDTA